MVLTTNIYLSYPLGVPTFIQSNPLISHRDLYNYIYNNFTKKKKHIYTIRPVSFTHELPLGKKNSYIFQTWRNPKKRVEASGMIFLFFFGTQPMGAGSHDGKRVHTSGKRGQTHTQVKAYKSEKGAYKRSGKGSITQEPIYVRIHIGNRFPVWSKKGTLVWTKHRRTHKGAGYPVPYIK